KDGGKEGPALPAQPPPKGAAPALPNEPAPDAPPPPATRPPTPEEADANRKTALAILKTGGSVGVGPRHGLTNMFTPLPEALPKEPFFLGQIQLQGGHVNDDTLKLFDGAKFPAIFSVRVSDAPTFR